MVASKTSFIAAAVALGAASVYAAPTPFNAGSDLVARGFEDGDFQLEARFFDDDAELEARNFEEADEIFACHFEDEEALFARDFDDDEELFAREYGPLVRVADVLSSQTNSTLTPPSQTNSTSTLLTNPKTQTKTPAVTAYGADNSRPSRAGPKNGKPHNENAPGHHQHHQHHHPNGDKDGYTTPKKVPTTRSGATTKAPKSNSVTTPKKVNDTPKKAHRKPKHSLSDLWDDPVACDEDGPKRHGRHHHGKHRHQHHHHHKRPKSGGNYMAKPKGDADDAAPPQVAERDIEDMVILARSLGLDDDYFLEERAFDDNMMEY